MNLISSADLNRFFQNKTKCRLVFILLLFFCSFNIFADSQLTGTLHVDNSFEVYISTDDAVEGTLISSGNNWPTAYTLSTTLSAGQEYYLHVKALDSGGVAGFLGDFELSSSDHTFSNGLATLNTNTTEWTVSKTGWSDYVPASSYGVNGVSPWGSRSSVNSNAEWIWSSDNNADNINYFSTRLVVPIITPSTTPVAEYRFDEAEYKDVDDEVIDSMGGFHGRAKNSQPAEGKICNAIDLSASGIEDYLILNKDILSGKSDFTLSLWAKTSKTGQQSILSGASSSSNNELIMWFPNSTNFRPHLKNVNNGSISNDSIANDEWQHLVWTRSGTQSCLYRNKVLQGCVTQTTGVLNIESLVLGQEQDSVGGGFSSSQAFDGLIDELVVFDSAITDTEIAQIYDNQNAGLGYNGSPRTCPIINCDASTLTAVGIRIDGNGTNTQINNTTEALSIHAAWLDAGSPASGFINGGEYNVAASGVSEVDRIDFGGSDRDYSGTLPYPGSDDGVSGSDFIVHASGTVSLPAGDYTVFVKSDDGFSFTMDTLSGDTISFNKFGSSSAGANNELRFEGPTGNSNTGGSFTLSEDSVFDVSAIFFERGGGDYLEISIANEILSNSAPSGYEVLQDGALGGKVEFGGCIVEQPSPLLAYHFDELSWDGTLNEVLDSSGNNNNGTAQGLLTTNDARPVLAGSPGTCSYAEFDGVNDYVAMGNPDSLNFTGNITLAAWIRPDSSTGIRNIIAHGRTASPDQGVVFRLNDGNYEVGSLGDPNHIVSSTIPADDVGAGNWVHLAGTYDGTAWRLFRNGVEISFATDTTGAILVSEDWAVGARGSGTERFFDGGIDEPRIYAEALSEAQILSLMDETRICPITACEANTLSAVGIRIDGSGTNSQINNTTEALDIHAAWIDAGSPVSGQLNSGEYNVAASGVSEVERIDFGGSSGDFSGTLPYPGAGNGVSGTDFLVHTSGIVSLPAGDYTIFVKSDDGFSFVIDTLSGDTVSFNKFGSSRAGASNELRFEGPTGNSNTGGSFTLSEDSVFEIAAIFFERGGGDYLEISIANEILANSAPSGYEVLQDGALGGKVKFGGCLLETPIPLLEYRFEENIWDGSAGEIIDNTGNGYNAQVNNNSSPLNTLPAIAGNPGTCGYASQDNGSIQVTGLPIDTVTEDAKTTVTFWMNWDGTNNVMPLGWNFHDIWMVNGYIGFNTWSSDVYGISSAGLANGWHHIAVEFTNGSVTDNRMHIDGVEQVLSQVQGSPNNNNAYVNSELRVGGVANSNAYNFHGLIDEFRVYESALSTAQIEAIMAETHACSNTPFVHHYEIIHDGQGLTCDSESVIIKACTDESCSSVTTEPVSLDFLADGAVISTETFSGTTTVEFNNTDAETITFSLANTSITAASPLVCDDSVGNSCDMIFRNAGFRFLYGPSNSDTIANQTSGLVFSDVLNIQAVENVDGVCSGLFVDSKNIDLSQENVDPGGTSGLSFSVNGADIAKHTSVTSTQLTFGANSIASIPSPVYNDAGQIRLHANYNVGGVELTGSSNAFWVSPAELVIGARSGVIELDGANAVATTTHPAGGIFEFSVSAYNGASPAAITQNYSPGQIQIMLARIGPTLADSVDGDLTYVASNTLTSSVSPVFENVTLSNFNAGVSTFSGARYSEVGVLNVDVQDSNYANESIVIDANAIDVGRFIPSYFTQTVAQDGVFQATCDARIAFTAYSGQRDEANNSIGAISYLDNPILEITAYNADGEITRNYFEDTQGSANDYMKLNASDIVVTPPNLDQAALGVDNTNLPLTANINTGTLSQNDLTVLPNVVALDKGVLHYQLSDNDNFFYNRSANALVAPFTSDIDFTIASISDTDFVSANSTEVASPTGVEIRFGRVVLENSFGPETSNLPQPLQLEHFDGTTFTFSSDNNCVGYDASKISLTNISLDPALTNVLGGIGNFLIGKTQAIELESPGAGNQGQLGVSYDAFDWLKYDWDTDGNYDDNPSAIATFGLYRADDRFFHWREVLN